MQAIMKAAGPGKIFSLSGPPPKLYAAKSRSKRPAVGIFEPYQEALPLESGHYSYVLDSRGRFHVERGNTRSHAGMVDGEPVGAAGSFWITRAGKVGKVTCTSRDYRFYIKDERNPTVAFVIDSFRRHQAFDVSQHALFVYSKGLADSFRVSAEGQPVDDDSEHQRRLDEEGQGRAPDLGFTASQIDAFRRHIPPPPPRLYPMKLDQSDGPLDFDSESEDRFEVGPTRPHYSPEDGPLRPGRKAFILDGEGRLVIGFGHHLLSGGGPVGAAGQFHIGESGLVGELSLNFSGHYRPPLSAEYARYTYRTLAAHPLLSFAPECRITARKTFDLLSALETIVFSREELTSDDPRLDLEIEQFEIRASFDEDVPAIEEEDES